MLGEGGGECDGRRVDAAPAAPVTAESSPPATLSAAPACSLLMLTCPVDSDDGHLLVTMADESWDEVVPSALLCSKDHLAPDPVYSAAGSGPLRPGNVRRGSSWCEARRELDWGIDTFYSDYATVWRSRPPRSLRCDPVAFENN